MIFQNGLKMSAIFRVRNHRMSFAIGPLQHSENSIYQAFNKTNCMLARLRNRKKSLLSLAATGALVTAVLCLNP
jgi:hypothetical protein